MFTPHPMRKGMLSLALLGGLGLAGEVRAAPRMRPVPLLELALRQLESADQTDLVKNAEEEVAAALVALGVPATVQPFPPSPVGLLVLHNRHKLRRSLVAIKMVQRDLRRRPGIAAATARSHLARAARDLEAALGMPFIF